MRDRRAVAMIAAFLACASVSTAAAEEVSPAVELPACGPRGAPTITSDGKGRIYQRWVPGRFGVEQGTFGCIEGSKRPQRLDPIRREDRQRPWLRPELIALSAPWVAYQENYVRVDVGELEVAVLNLRTGGQMHCFIDRWSAAAWGWFTMKKVVVSPAGNAAWIGIHDERSGPVREVVACRGSVLQRLDSGPAIALDSLRLDGAILRWSNAGSLRSAMLG